MNGMERRDWLDGKIANALNYYLGPTGIPERLNALGMLNPVQDIGESMAAARDGDYIGAATSAAAAAAPVIAGGYLARNADDAAMWLEEALAGLSYRPEVLGARAFAVDEAGNIDLPGGAARTPAQTEAQNILDLLQSGRASEVTDDMMAAADDAYLFNNYDLPMDEASRMQRAREMGFDTDAPLYHGTGGLALGTSLTPAEEDEIEAYLAGF